MVMALLITFWNRISQKSIKDEGSASSWELRVLDLFLFSIFYLRLEFYCLWFHTEELAIKIIFILKGINEVQYWKLQSLFFSVTGMKNWIRWQFTGQEIGTQKAWLIKTPNAVLKEAKKRDFFSFFLLSFFRKLTGRKIIWPNFKGINPFPRFRCGSHTPEVLG